MKTWVTVSPTVRRLLSRGYPHRDTLLKGSKVMPCPMLSTFPHIRGSL